MLARINHIDIAPKAVRAVVFGGGRGVGKIFGFSKANVYNWIKKNDDS